MTVMVFGHPLGRSRADSLHSMADSLDLDAFVQRFRERAKAVKNRPLPPVEGAERARFKERMQQDFLDFALVGDAVPTFEDGVITLRIDVTGAATPASAPETPSASA